MVLKIISFWGISNSHYKSSSFYNSVLYSISFGYFLLRYWHDILLTYIIFRCTTYWLDIYIHCKGSTHKSSYHPSPCIVKNFFSCDEAFQVDSLSSFQIYNTMLLTSHCCTSCLHNLLTSLVNFLIVTEFVVSKLKRKFLRGHLWLCY